MKFLQHRTVDNSSGTLYIQQIENFHKSGMQGPPARAS